MSDTILIERPERLDGAVQVIRFNRPDKKNAFTRRMYAAMTTALQTGDRDARRPGARLPRKPGHLLGRQRHAGFCRLRP